jgi:hypothetical protein
MVHARHGKEAREFRRPAVGVGVELFMPVRDRIEGKDPIALAVIDDQLMPAARGASSFGLSASGGVMNSQADSG